MRSKLRVLNLEDNPRDSELIQRELEGSGIVCDVVRVETEEEYRRALDSEPFDLIISDFSRPSFDGARGLELARVLRPETPFLFFSGAIGEEAAIESLKNGATDYVLKQTPARLVSALLRALNEAAERRRRRLAEEALIESERRFRTVVESAPDGIFIQVNRRFAYVNAAALRLFGALSSDQLVGQTVLDRVHPDFRGEVSACIHQLNVERKRVQAWEEKFLRLDGSAVDVEACAVPFSYGDEAGTLVFIHDITKRLRRTESLVRLSSAVEQAAEMIFMTDRDGTIIYVNPAFERAYGYSKEEVIGKTPRVIQSGQSTRDDYQSFWRQILEGKHFRGELVNRARDGKLIVVDASVSRVLDPGGQLAGFIAVQTDVTEKKRAQEEQRVSRERMFHLGKMEAIGTMSAGFAHDFNNILAVALSFCELAERSRNEPQRFANAVGMIRQAVGRGAELSNRLLAFARKTEVKLSPMNVNRLIREVIGMSQQIFPGTITFSTLLADDQPLVMADASQMHEVLLNLFVNARDAMPGGGVIAVESRVATAAEIREKFSDGSIGEAVCIRVSDTGTGMSEQTRSRVFDPFFTTKGEKGTGLGLAVAFGVITALGGLIRLESQEGEGSTFELFLPVAATGESEPPDAVR
jgi:PAS domain S-box-containing protein